jgi:hypothetical protein
MWLRKENGGCSVGSYEWPNDGDVVEVDDRTATELLAIKGGDYTIATPPSPPSTAAAKKAAAAATPAPVPAAAAK